jgi:hypothetical protein
MARVTTIVTTCDICETEIADRKDIHRVVITLDGRKPLTREQICPNCYDYYLKARETLLAQRQAKEAKRGKETAAE